ncbi:MAG: DUF559 domain-containing protein [Acidimicrobiales bacterium]
MAASSESWRQNLTVAILAAGKGSVASHRAAAVLHQLDGAGREIVEISVPASHKPTKREDVRIHRVVKLERIDVTKVDGIPVTSVTRTLIDLGAVADADTVEAALESALRTRRTSLSLLDQRLGALSKRGKPGPATLRKILGSRLYGAPSASVLETRFVQLCRRYRLPQGARQYPVELAGRVARVDFAWDEHKLLVELEGFGTHGTPADHSRDMGRQNAILRSRPGWVLLRYGWSDVVEHPERVATELEEVLRLHHVARRRPRSTASGVS